MGHCALRFAVCVASRRLKDVCCSSRASAECTGCNQMGALRHSRASARLGVAVAALMARGTRKVQSRGGFSRGFARGRDDHGRPDTRRAKLGLALKAISADWLWPVALLKLICGINCVFTTSLAGAVSSAPAAAA